MAIQLITCGLAGAGNASINVGLFKAPMQARFAGAGNLQTLLQGPYYIKARFAGAGGLKAPLRQYMAASAAFAGAGATSAVLNAIAHMSAHLAGTSGAGMFFGPNINASFGGAGNIVFDLSNPVQFISASFAGAGGLKTWLDWQGTDNINPGIDEIAGEELLYANAAT